MVNATNSEDRERAGNGRVAKELDKPSDFSRWKLQMELHFAFETESEELFNGDVVIEQFDEDVRVYRKGQDNPLINTLSRRYIVAERKMKKTLIDCISQT